MCQQNRSILAGCLRLWSTPAATRLTKKPHQIRRKAVTEYPESCCEDTAGIREMKRRNPAVSLSLKPTYRDIWSPWSKTQTRRGPSLGGRDFYSDPHQWIFIRNDPVHQWHLKSTHWTSPGQIPPPFTLIIYMLIWLILGFSTLPSVCLWEGRICLLLRSLWF